MTGVALTRSTHIPCEEAHTHHARECAPPFVIPNAVRNLASKREEILRFALNDKRLDADMNIPPQPPFKGKSEAKRWEIGQPPRRRAESLT